ncbi:MAG: hypothetical protein FLDDKLPJ_00153 [Phycisphaerae bacterium]|nr:hypothetical protein [Phycisphaerae bacterium]
MNPHPSDKPPHEDERWGVARDGRPLYAKPRLRWYADALLLGAIGLALYFLFYGLMRVIPWRGWGWGGWSRIQIFFGAIGPVLGMILRHYLYLGHNNRAVKQVLATGLTSCLRCGYDLRHLGEAGHCPECGQAFRCEDVRRLWKAWLSRNSSDHDFIGDVDFAAASEGRPYCLRCGGPVTPGLPCDACQREREAERARA